MNSAISNLIILTAEVNGNNILGTAIDSDIKVLFTVAQSEVNQRLFLPEANLVVSGKFRLGRDACTVGISITSVIAVVSLPVAVPSHLRSTGLWKRRTSCVVERFIPKCPTSSRLHQK